MKRIIISDNTVNGRGFRVLTDGILLDRYMKNPVLLWMHARGTVIGYVKDLRVEDGVLTGEPVFDCATDLSKQLKAQYEAGSVRACSMGIDVLEVVEEPVASGAIVPVVAQCELFEVSLVDVPENPSAVTLRHAGKPIEPSQLITLAKSAPHSADIKPTTIKTDIIMNLTELALLLGLAEGATEDEVKEAVKALLAHKTQLETKLNELTEQREREELAHIERTVDNAVSEQRITASKREHYIDLGKKVGNDALQSIFDDMPRPKRIVETLDHSSAGTDDWKKLSDVPEGELLTLRKEDPQRYARLYKAEYGIEMPSEKE